VRARSGIPPLIGILCDAVPGKKGAPGYRLVCRKSYAAAVENAGGAPVLLPISRRREALRRYVEELDGLVIPGGWDVDPALYGEKPARQTRIVHPERAAFETSLYRMAKRRRMPILAVCYGMQLVNVLEGGTLHQHLFPGRKGPRIDHRGKKSPLHTIEVTPGTRLHAILGAGRARVLTSHHQAVRAIAPGFVCAATAADGTVEAIEHPDRPEILAVQWHPEVNPRSGASRRLFGDFLRSCRAYRQRRPAP
jgi:putative glutamine amidotransferase